MIIDNQILYAMGDNRETAIRVPQNQAVTFHTRDCFNGQITSENYVMEGLDWNHINPATGPVYVEGARAGDVLKVEILEIELEEEGTMCCLPDNGVLGRDIRESSVKKIPVKDGHCLFRDKKLPLNPMIGVIGAGGGAGSLRHAGKPRRQHGQYPDCPGKYSVSARFPGRRLFCLRRRTCLHGRRGDYGKRRGNRRKGYGKI